VARSSQAADGQNLFGSAPFMMISVVIPNYNGASLLRKNLPRLLELLKKSKLGFELIIVDDCSIDDSVSYLRSLSSLRDVRNLKVIEKEKNEGFPTTADQGIRAAKGDVVFVIKNDAVPESPRYFKLILDHFENTKKEASVSEGLYRAGSLNPPTDNRSSMLSKIVYFVKTKVAESEGLEPYPLRDVPVINRTTRFANSPSNHNYNIADLPRKVFAVVSSLRTEENGREEIRGQGRIVFFRGMFLHFRRKDEYEEWLKTTRTGRGILSKEVDGGGGPSGRSVLISAWADGGASAFRKDLYLKIGGFDPVFRPGYWEDTDLGYRAWKAGYKIIFEPKAVLLHDFESGTYRKKYGQEKIKLINLRNQFIFTLKNGDLSSVLKFFLWETYNHLAAVKAGERGFVLAYWMAMARLPEIIRSRIRQKGINRLSDEEVLAKFESF